MQDEYIVEAKSQLEMRLLLFKEWADENWNFSKPLRFGILEDNRNNQQNAYLWGFLYRTIAKQLQEKDITLKLDDGTIEFYTTRLLHEIFKERFLTYKTLTLKGKTRHLCYSTAELSRSSAFPDSKDEKPSFSYYVEEIKEFCQVRWNILID